MVERGTLSREAIVEAAARMVDRDGLEAFSMRRLGAEIGADPMALYHHVPNRAALLQALVDLFLGHVPLPAADGPWQDRLRAWSRGFRAAALAHPGLFLAYSRSDSWSVPYLAMEEWLYRTLREGGFAPLARVRSARLLLAYCENFVLWELSDWIAPYDAAERAALDAVLARGDFPEAAALADHIAGIDPDAEFAFGLEATLRGLTDARA